MSPFTRRYVLFLGYDCVPPHFVEPHKSSIPTEFILQTPPPFYSLLRPQSSYFRTRCGSEQKTPKIGPPHQNLSFSVLVFTYLHSHDTCAYDRCLSLTIRYITKRKTCTTKISWRIPVPPSSPYIPGCRVLPLDTIPTSKPSTA